MSTTQNAPAGSARSTRRTLRCRTRVIGRASRAPQPSGSSPAPRPTTFTATTLFVAVTRPAYTHPWPPPPRNASSTTPGTSISGWSSDRRESSGRVLAKPPRQASEAVAACGPCGTISAGRGSGTSRGSAPARSRTRFGRESWTYFWGDRDIGRITPMGRGTLPRSVAKRP